MSSDGRDPVPTRSAYLELAAERGFVREGRDFLDHKRMLLAAEILRQVRAYRAIRARLDAAHRDAQRALAEAIALHGPRGLEVHPQGTMEVSPPRAASFLGITLMEAEAPLGHAPPREDGLFPSPEVRRCRARFQALIGLAVRLAAHSSNLERLLRDYRRTERRARALEDVILPELTRTLKRTLDRLEEVDQEEVLRSRTNRSS